MCPKGVSGANPTERALAGAQEMPQLHGGFSQPQFTNPTRDGGDTKWAAVLLLITP